MIWYVPQEICKEAAEYANKEAELIPTEFDAQIVNGHALAAKKRCGSRFLVHAHEAMQDAMHKMGDNGRAVVTRPWTCMNESPVMSRAFLIA